MAQEYTTHSQPAVTIAGIACRTSNAHAEQIGELWRQFYESAVFDRIPGKRSNDVYAVYYEYASDYTGSFSMLIGCAIDPAVDLPEGLTRTTVPAGTFAIFEARAEQPEASSAALISALIATWQEIWQLNLPRIYTADFDLYPAASEGRLVLVHVAIEGPRR